MAAAYVAGDCEQVLAETGRLPRPEIRISCGYGAVSITLPPGEYTVLVRPASRWADEFTSLYGTWGLQAGTRYDPCYQERVGG